MSKIPGQITELNQQAAETALKLVRLSIEQGEQLMKLHTEAVRAMLDDGMKGAKALIEVRDPQQWGALQERSLRDMLARLTEYARGIQELAGQSRQEIGGLVGNRIQAMNTQFEAIVEDMARSAPPGAEPAVAAIRQTLAAASGLAETMAKTAEQFAGAAESAIKAAGDAAARAEKGGGKADKGGHKSKP